MSMTRMMSEMNNRQRYILNANEYDFLIRIQHYLKQYITDFEPCVINVITGKTYYCSGVETCEECLQHWLNEDERKGVYT